MSAHEQTTADLRPIEGSGSKIGRNATPTSGSFSFFRRDAGGSATRPFQGPRFRATHGNQYGGGGVAMTTLGGRAPARAPKYDCRRGKPAATTVHYTPWDPVSNPFSVDSRFAKDYAITAKLGRLPRVTPYCSGEAPLAGARLALAGESGFGEQPPRRSRARCFVLFWE